MYKQLKKWILVLGLCNCGMTVQAEELPDCGALAMMLAPLVVVPGTLQAPAKRPLGEVIARIGHPSKKLEIGNIYYWYKNGYTLSVIITKIDNREQLTTSLELPVKHNLTASQIKDEVPLEFTKVMQASSPDTLLIAEKLIGITQKLKMYSYVWSCYAESSVVNGNSVTRKSTVTINFDEKGRWINGTF
jgi:hypothetical protein